LDGVILEEHVAPVAGIVDQQIDPPAALEDGGDGALDARPLGDVASERMGLAPGAPDLARERLEAVGPAGEECDAHAARREVAGELGSDAARGAGDDPDGVAILWETRHPARAQAAGAGLALGFTYL